MRVAALRNGRMEVDDFPEPVPEEGQVLVQVKACGICGSDLHFAHDGASILRIREELEGMDAKLDVDLGQAVFMGHEFCVEVLEPGPNTPSFPIGTIVTAYPGLVTREGPRSIGYSNSVHAGYGERMLLTAARLLEVTNGLPATHAALNEPLAVGLHAVKRGDVEPGTGAIVLGTGPIGQAIIATLKPYGVAPIVAVDLSSTRLALAKRMGADVAVDPRVESAFDVWKSVSSDAQQLVVFEAIGMPGIINDVLRTAPPRTRIVVAGICSGNDTVTPRFAIMKELDIRGAYAYNADEYAEALRLMSEGDVDVGPLITGEVSLDGVQQAFDDLATPELHCKILVRP